MVIDLLSQVKSNFANIGAFLAQKLPRVLTDSGGCLAESLAAPLLEIQKAVADPVGTVKEGGRKIRGLSGGGAGAEPALTADEEEGSYGLAGLAGRGGAGAGAGGGAAEEETGGKRDLLLGAGKKDKRGFFGGGK